MSRVFLGSDFVAVTKTAGEWQHLKPALLGAIMEHFQFGRPLLDKGETEVPVHAAAASEEDADIVEQIVELIETRVRPAVAAGRRRHRLPGFESASGTVYLNMRGACSGCPSSRRDPEGRDREDAENVHPRGQRGRGNLTDRALLDGQSRSKAR